MSSEKIKPVAEIDYILSDDDETSINEIRAITGWPLPNPIAVSTNRVTRFENYLRNKLKEKEDLKFKSKKFPEGNPNAKREDFGPGKVGEWSFHLIKNGAECTAYINDEKTECGKLSIGTVDVDIRYDLDLFPFCSTEHRKVLTYQLLKDTKANGETTTPSINGFGRDLHSEMPMSIEAQET